MTVLYIPETRHLGRNVLALLPSSLCSRPRTHTPGQPQTTPRPSPGPVPSMSELQQVLPASVGGSGAGDGEGTELQVGYNKSKHVLYNRESSGARIQHVCSRPGSLLRTTSLGHVACSRYYGILSDRPTAQQTLSQACQADRQFHPFYVLKIATKPPTTTLVVSTAYGKRERPEVRVWS